MREVEQSGCRKRMRDGCDTNKRVIGRGNDEWVIADAASMG